MKKQYRADQAKKKRDSKKKKPASTPYPSTFRGHYAEINRLKGQ